MDIIGKRLWYYLISGIVILVAIIALGVLGLQPGIEFSSGSRLRVTFEDQAITQQQLQEAMAEIGHPEAIIETEVVSSGQGDFFIRTSKLLGNEKDVILADLSGLFGTVTEQEFSDVSAEASLETTRSATIAVVVAAVGILLYVTWAFRRMPKPFHYGTCAIIALVHDALIALGVFAILGAIMNWQINLMFITGILAVIGYSVNNTVVIFDRIRENLLTTNADFETIVNHSLVETLGRSFNTSITTLIVSIALLLFVGASIQNFIVVLIAGVIAGTWSSVFIAPSLLVTWERKEWGRLLSRSSESKAKA